MAKYELMVKNETIATFRLDLEDDDDCMKDEVRWMRFEEQFPCTIEALQGIEGVSLSSAMGHRKPMEDFDMSRLVLEWEADNKEREEMSREEIRDFACNIYDGDWRAADTDEEFRVQWPYLTDWELQTLKEELQAIEDDLKSEE